MNTTPRQTEENDAEGSAAISQYHRDAQRAGKIGLVLWLLLILGGIGVIVAGSLSWDTLKSHGQLWLLGLFACSVGLLMYVIHCLGRSSDTPWIESIADLRAVIAKRMRKD